MQSSARHSWQDYAERVVPADTDRVELGDATYILAEENGFDALLVWSAGPQRAFRSAVDFSSYTMVVSRTGADGKVQCWREARTAADQEIVRDFINQYLQEAGLPQQPDGYRWFVRLPCASIDPASFRQAVARANTATAPREVLTRLRAIYESLDQS